MKRIVCLIAAVCVCFGSAFAWNAESFLSDGSAEYQPYSLDPVEDPALDLAQVPMMLSLDDGVAVASDTVSSSMGVLDFYNSGLLDFDTLTAVVYTGSIYVPNVSGGYEIPVTNPLEFDFSSSSLVVADWGSTKRLYASPLDGPVIAPSQSTYTTYDGWSFPYYSYVEFIFSVPQQYKDSPFMLSGALGSLVTLDSGFGEEYVWADSVSVFADNELLFSRVGGQVFQLNNFLWDSTSSASTIRLRFSFPVALGDDYIANQQFFGGFAVDFVDFDISFLNGDDVLSGFNDQAQNDINEHQSIESEWTGSMTQNFNALDLSGFTFPGGLVSAFALITGIFNDLWNGMGDYKILYVFPLTLGVVLLLIGRISKFSGRSSSGRSGKGDDSA